MTAISSINPSADSSVTRSAPHDRFSDLSSEDFIKIIFTELSNQDPFKPNDSSALLQQLSSIRSIESDLTLTDQLKSLVTQNQLSAAGGMIGKFIGGVTDDNKRVAGIVVSVARENDKVNLELDNGWVVPINNVERVIDPGQLPGNSGGSNSTSTTNTNTNTNTNASSNSAPATNSGG
jgi:flagellar basal-body rod modification protein FlgD